MLRRTHVFWVGCAIFGLAIGLPAGWGLLQFHKPQQGSGGSSGNPAQQQPDGHKAHDWMSPEAWLVYITGALAVATFLLFWSTKRLATDADRSSKKALAASTKATATLVNIERAYLTGGGDVENRGGRKHFRIDVANYGKTAAYLTNYEIHFAAKLADVQGGAGKVYKPCMETSSVFDDRIAPDNKTKVIGYIEMEPEDAEIIYGCFWYTDWRKDQQYFRFILRVEQFTGRTRPDVGPVDDSYREWT